MAFRAENGRDQQRRGRMFRRSRGRHLDRQLAFRSGRLYARHRPGHQPAGGRGRHGGLASGKHTGGDRPDSLGPRIPRHASLQRRLPVLPASDHHGHTQSDADLHRQPGASLVLWRQELQRNQYRRRAGRDRQRDLQRLRSPDSRASHHPRKDHGWFKRARRRA